MKKFIFIFAALFLGLSQANAQEIYVDNFTAPEGGVMKFDVKYRGIGDKTIQGYIFKFEFPEGLSLVTEDDIAIFEYGEGNTSFDVKTTATGVQASPKSKTSQLAGNEGTLVTLTLQVNDPLAQGDVATVKVYDASLTQKVVNTDGTSSYKDLDTDPFTFDVTIVENIVTLDENSTTAPEAAENVNVLVKRSVKSGNWGTICLPFDMTPEQMTAAFGEGVALADFNDYDVVEEGEGKNAELVGITVKFNTVTTGIAKNHPYILKATQNITYEEGFKVENVSIDPAEPDDLEINLNTSRKPHSIIGTYVPATIDELCLFLSGNKFYYSTGKTKIKGFRAWFNFDDILTEVDDVYGAKVSILVDGESTTIDGMGYQRIVEGVYDLSGRKIQLQDGDLNKLQKGVYIIDGKKVTIK